MSPHSFPSAQVCGLVDPVKNLLLMGVVAGTQRLPSRFSGKLPASGIGNPNLDRSQTLRLQLLTVFSDPFCDGCPHPFIVMRNTIALSNSGISRSLIRISRVLK